ncbi:MAG: twin-arginine translocase subunit TatC, partial [Dehalococcoidia bacterium]
MASDSTPTATMERDRSPEGGKELTILEHLQELRRRLIVCAAAIVIAVLGSLVLTNKLLEWLTAPAHDRVQNVTIVFTDPLGYWAAYFRVSLVAGIAIAMPVLVYQALAFVS